MHVPPVTKRVVPSAEFRAEVRRIKLKSPPALRTAEVVHSFWRERMRDAPSLDHAFACILSGIELDAVRMAVAS